MDVSALQALQAAMPFANLLGVELTAAAPEEVRGTLAWSEDRCTTGGMLHGGALMGLADSLGGVCAFLNLPEGAGTTTIESKTNFLRGVSKGVVEAITRPLHVGRRFIVIETDLFDDRGKRVARVTQTQAVLT
jgi:1,4-dihydroxy-2-naphthoyl-CoA hydrolase